MQRSKLIQNVQQRKKALNITIENLAKISGIGTRTLNRFFAGEDVRISTVEKLTEVLGLDLAGNEIMSLEDLQKQRANIKARFMASLVQSTSTLEMQGIERKNLNKIINKFEKQFLEGEYRDRLWVA